MKGEPKSILVVCAANLSASAQCPDDCRKCFYGGDIAIQWNFLDQGYVEYYPNREAVRQDSEDLSSQDIRSEAEQAKVTALQDWLCSHSQAKQEMPRTP